MLGSEVRGVMLPGGWLFPGQKPVNHRTSRQRNRAFHSASSTLHAVKSPLEHLKLPPT